MPIGAVVIVEHWIFPRFGLSGYRASSGTLLSNWPALAAWFISIVIAMFLWQANILHLFFLFIPVWFLTVVLYIVFVVVAGVEKARTISVHEKDNKTPGDEERASGPGLSRGNQVWFWISGIIALLALLLCLILPIQVFVIGIAESSDRLESMKTILIWLSLVYFVGGTIWIHLKEKSGKGR